MAMLTAYLNGIANAGSSLVKFIGLGDTANVEITGGSPAYTRQAVSWNASSGGVIRPTANLTFDIPAGVTVANWKAYPSSINSTVSSDASNGGSTLTAEVYAGQGQYILLAASTSITHTST